MLERGRDILADVIRSEETSEAADGIAFAFVGKNKNGIRKYETDFHADMPQAERGRLFKERLATIFNLGAVELKTDVKKIKVQADRITYKKNIYGDVGGIDSISAKVNALYDLVDILETSVFKSATMEPSFANENVAAKNLAHKGVKYWYKFENHIILDGVPYKVVFNIRDKGKEQYQYLIEFDKETAQNSNKKRTSANDTAADGQLRAFMQKSSDTTVSQNNSGVNSKYTQNSKKDADIDGFSVGGVNAKTADVGRLADAERMEQGGADSETVRRETGWYRGYDGKWRFEIDDSKMHFINHREESRRTWKLDELIRHDALFAAYPELRDYTVLNFGISDDVEAAFYPGLNRITLDPRLSRAEKRAALIHEIQHAIQLIEGFTAGATTDYWRDSLKTAEEKQLELRLRDFDAPDIFFEADMRKLLEGTPAAERDAAQTALEKHYGEAPVREYVDLYNRLRDLRAEREQDAERAYRNTAGEIEASDVANRIGLSEMQRAETRPDIDREEVRFSNEHPMFTMEARQTDADADTEVSDADKRFAPVESAIKLLQGGADLWRTLRETGASPREIALRMATSGESDTAIRELTGLYRDALGVWTYDKAWFDAHVPDIADTRELRAGYKLGTVDEQLLGLAPEEVKASRRRLLDSAAMTKIVRAGGKQLDVQDFTDFLFENAKELTESSYNSQYGHRETYALSKLGVQIQNPIVDIAKYGTKPSELIANEREQKELKRYIENEYVSAAHPSPAERADARDVKREFLPDMKTVGEVARFYLDRTKWRMLYCVHMTISEN